MDKFILRFILSVVKIIVRKGVDFEKLKIIAETKILMDRRRVYMNWKMAQQKETKNPLLITLIVYAFFGLFIGSMIFVLNSFMLNMIFIHSYVLFMMCMTIITDFSSVLLDTADNQIILHKPVNSKTLFVARLIHILVYLLQFTIALSTFPIIFIFIKFGIITGVTAIVTILLTVAFAVFFTYLLYALVLRFSNEQKLKDIVGYFQIFMTVFFAVGFQILPRLMNFSQLEAGFTLHTYSYILPPVWMALTLDSVHFFNFDTIHIIMIFCAFTVPLFTFWIMIKFLAPAFANKLAALNAGGALEKNTKTFYPTPKCISSKISGIICSSQTERSSFEMVWKITGRDKNFKLQFYPSLAYILVFIFIFVFKSGQNAATLWQNLPGTKMFLFFIYLPMFTLAGSVTFITTHENFQASWIYQSTPIAKPGHLIIGGLKVILTKFFILIYISLFCFAWYIWGVSITDDFILGLFNNLLIFLLVSTMQDHYLPFSRQVNIKQQSGKFVQVIIQMALIAGLIGIHYLILKNAWLTYALIPFSLAGCYFLFQRIKNLPWLKISF